MPTYCQVFGTDYREEEMTDDEMKQRLFMQTKSELVGKLVFAYRTIQNLEAKLEGAKNTEQQVQADNLPEDGNSDYYDDPKGW